MNDLTAPASRAPGHLRGRALLLGLVLLAASHLVLAQAQGSPFMTGATSLQTNILAWLTPIAVILVMVLGAMAMANRIIENCANTMILRCSGSEHGGTSQFASRLIGEREVIRRQTTRGRDREGLFAARGARRSTNTSEQHVIEAAVLAAQIEQLPDLVGYLKTASSPAWLQVRIAAYR
jgi:hypothetical protein